MGPRCDDLRQRKFGTVNASRRRSAISVLPRGRRWHSLRTTVKFQIMKLHECFRSSPKLTDTSNRFYCLEDIGSNWPAWPDRLIYVYLSYTCPQTNLKKTIDRNKLHRQSNQFIQIPRFGNDVLSFPLSLESPPSIDFSFSSPSLDLCCAASSCSLSTNYFMAIQPLFELAMSLGRRGRLLRCHGSTTHSTVSTPTVPSHQTSPK